MDPDQRPRRVPWQGAAFGLLTMVAVAAVLGLVSEVTDAPFLPYAWFEWLTRVLPGAVVTFGIDVMVDAIRATDVGPTAEIAKLAEAVLATLLFVAIGPAAGFILGALAPRARNRLPWLGLAAGIVVFGSSAFVLSSLGFRDAGAFGVAAWAVVLVAWGFSLGITVQAVAARSDETRVGGSRRRFLRIVGSGAVAISALAFGLGRWLRHRRGEPVAPAFTSRAALVQETSGPAASPPERILAARIAPASGTRPEITKTEDFYRIDINLRPPRLDAARWRLRVEGLVATPLSLSLGDLRARPAVSQMITLQCISNRIGGDLISTARFTGVRLGAVLREAGLGDRAGAVYVEAADGFYESVSMAEAMDARTLLVYAMNGVPLPQEHGYPLRISIPNRYGMKQPKWITRLEVIEQERPGYWVERGWSREAIPNTTSVIDTVGTGMRLGERTVLPVGGIAYAGARGISRVELQVDDGPWAKATLVAPPLGPLTWVQWRYDWPYLAGTHTFRVRAYDGTGALQPVAQRGPRPDGATGIHEIVTTV